MSGLRYNQGKLRYDLLHPFATEQLVNVLTKGATKYEERNWEKGMKWSTVIASIKRHLASIEKGEDYDRETGELHAAHLACNAHFLTAYYKIAPQYDDRQHSYLKHLKIGLDIDEVLSSFTPAWMRKFNITNVPTSWFFDSKMQERFDKLKEDRLLDSFYLSLEPLTKPEDIPFEPHCYVTSRPVSTEVTEKWLEHHGYPIRPIFTVPPNTSKVDIVKITGCDIFVDDRFDNFVELNNAGICTYLFDAPHNQRYDVGFKRIKSLYELM